MRLKQLLVINTDGLTANIPVGFLKSSLITYNQSLAIINAEISTSYTINLDTKLIPSSNVVNGYYKFSLVVDD